MGDRNGAYRVLVGKPERKSSVGRLMHRWQGNIKIDLQEVSCGERNGAVSLRKWERWRAIVNAVMNIPKNAGKFLTC